MTRILALLPAVVVLLALVGCDDLETGGAPHPPDADPGAMDAATTTSGAEVPHSGGGVARHAAGAPTDVLPSASTTLNTPAAHLPFAFVVTAGGQRFAVLDVVPADDAITGPIEAVDLTPESSPVVLTRTVRDAALPAVFASDAGRVRAFGARGEVCAARLGTPRAMVRAQIEFDLWSRWTNQDGAVTEGGPPTDDEVADATWTTYADAAFLAAPLEGVEDCEGALFVAPSTSPPSLLAAQIDAAEVPEADAIAARALVRFRAHDDFARIQREYVSEGWGTGRWDDSSATTHEVRYFRTEATGETWIVVSANAEGLCGDFWASLHVAWAIEADGTLTERTHGELGAPPASFFDLDRDGRVDALTTDALFLKSSEGATRDIVPPSYDCPC